MSLREAQGRTRERPRWEKETDSPNEKPKSKHLIHIPRNTSLSPDRFVDQTQLNSSPSRIRGVVWKRPQKPPSLNPKPANLNPKPDPPFTKRASPPRQRNGTPTRTFPAREHNSVNDDIAMELADLPSDAFSSTPSPDKAASENVFFSAELDSSQNPQGQRVAAPRGNLVQTTLFGATASQLQSSQTTRRHNWPLANKNEPPTHHKLEEEALPTWIYPTNLGSIRDYQFNIVSRGLFHNLLVALPTGLGKTFIAATVMLNWYRWTKEAQIVFVAPTKPLVAQQVDACFHIAGIPRHDTTLLTGETPPGIRAEEWQSKRVFFMTPQTIINDLKTGICDPKKIVLLVVDEAHRATGNYAYVEVVKFLRRFNTSFRVLALTATPGSSVETVQEVIDGLDISRTEIRTEDSLDIRQYVHSRRVDTEVFEDTEDMIMAMDLFSKAVRPVMNKLAGANAYWSRDPMALSNYRLTQARKQWATSDAGKRANPGLKGMVQSIFGVLNGLAPAVEMVKYHGLGPFYQKLLNWQSGSEEGQKNSKYRTQIVNDEHFKKLMFRLKGWINNTDFVGHPKLEHLRSVVLNHFMDAGEGRETSHGQPPSSTKIMIFVSYRDSAEEIVRVLKRNDPMIRPHVFVGQAATVGSAGMDQKKQLEVIGKFKQGIYNTLVATSIGEEGLDIGEIDLIVCYDSSASPIRMLQRMGRTGRKRAGNIVLLLMKGKEEESYAKAKDNYEKMQQMIAAGTRFNYHDDRSPRILPREIQPVVDKRDIDIPIENTQGDLPEPRKRARAPKRPPKKFHMPDGVQTGFVKASKVGSKRRLDEELDEDEDDEDDVRSVREVAPAKLVGFPPLSEVLLSESELRQLNRNYRDVPETESKTVRVPSGEAFPDLQRTLRQTRHVKHGTRSIRMVNTLRAMSEVTCDCEQQFQSNLNPADTQARRTKRFPSIPSPEALNGTEELHGSDDFNFSKVQAQEDEDAELLSESESLPGLSQSNDQPFYVSQKSYGDDSDEELPDVEQLVRSDERRATPGSKHIQEGSISSEISQPTRAKPRRRVVFDSDED